MNQTLQPVSISQTMLDYVLEPNALKNRVVVISGSTGGLGTALSKACARAGASVVLVGRSLEKLEALYDVIEQIEGAAQPAMVKIDQAEAMEPTYTELQSMLKSEFGVVDALVHCAADTNTPGPQTSIKQSDWSRVMAVNLSSARLLTNACLPLLSASDIASVTMTTDSKTGAYWGAYAVSKLALNEFAFIVSDETSNQRNEAGSPVFAVNAVDPGPMRTRLRRKTFPGELESETTPPDNLLGPFLYCIARADKSLTGCLLSYSNAEEFTE